MDAATDLKVVREVFSRIAPIELAYREQPEDLAPVFDDIRQTALCISTRGLEGKGQFQLLQDGIISMQPFTIGSRYVIEDATVDAAKAALLATMIERGVIVKSGYFSHVCSRVRRSRGRHYLRHLESVFIPNTWKLIPKYLNHI